MHRKFNHQEIEKKWQERWRDEKLYEVSDEHEGKEKRYVLTEYPYPSGNLHIGHWHAFAVPDIFARATRMQGKHVLYPVGFDSFGLPAENAAIKHKLDPKKWTYDNIAHMQKQLESMGNSYDWSRKVITSDPNYYRWTQWIFLQLFKNKLAYRGTGLVNWCPSCNTVLANEQVVNGECERCGSQVEQREMPQWLLKITDYADRLIDDLASLDWPEPIKESQRNWIGRSEGAEIGFAVEFEKEDAKPGLIPIFTTRPDTLFGATFLILSPEHPWITLAIDNEHDVLKNKAEVKAYVEAAAKKTEIERQGNKEKSGVKLDGVWAVNPATGEKIPIYVADYVIASYGTGTIMGVPAHDRRDREFATARNLPVVDVVKGGGIQIMETAKINGDSVDVFVGDGELINSGKFTGMQSREAKEPITEFVGGKMTNTYRLRDWSVGRQRYWGCPIPIVYDPEGKAHAVPDEHLPWLLPEDVDFTPTGVAPLAKSEVLKKRTVDIFGEGWTPEVETMDTFVDSSWYFLRYTDPKNTDVFASKEKQEAWMPIDVYFGGAEHTTMHLLYSRFVQKVLFDLKLTTVSEPYKVRINRGLVLGPDGNKMSKSKGNVIDPDEQVARLGADTVKMYLAFMGPYGEVTNYPWDMGGIAGIRRFLERVNGLMEHIKDEAEISFSINHLIHLTIWKVTKDIGSFKFNTAISQMMILVNHLEKQEKGITNHVYETLLLLLAPFAPHLTEDLWSKLDKTTSIHQEQFPDYDPKALELREVTIAIQIDGKVRATIIATIAAEEESVKETALKEKGIADRLNDVEIIRVVYIPGKVINFITR
jgi:leucyl-tRNA synthetase